MKYTELLIILIVCWFNFLFSQNENKFYADYETLEKYELGGVQFSGIQYLDESVLINIAGLQIGDTISIPGEKITQAIQKLWEQGLFSNITVYLNKTIGNTAFLTIELTERPRLSKFSFSGIKKGEADDIREKIRLVRGNQVTDNVIAVSKNIIKKHFYEKGFYNCQVNVTQSVDTTLANHVILTFEIEKGNKFKISDIQFIGDNIHKNFKLYDSLKAKQKLLLVFNQSPYINLRKAMKETKVKKWYRLFKTSRIFEDKYAEDKIKVIEKLNSYGYRDARIIKDTLFLTSDKTVGIKIWLEPGNKFYFRNIRWVGNSKYSTDTLNYFLGIKKAKFTIKNY